ncbi:hypothetical protein [Sphingobium nicotianae]|uniref:Uncharacterized protein n=1 Tax=Sphingobium nicotianae TaxID=2782607 RepID=A0A9X1DDJ7_9SPHN|nr:hypothetical protein [Sphingobium nicotianae]MBT2187909.1 hypothetical protein [Sphingobium nicotianae]
MSFRLTLGLSEDGEYQWPRITNDAFSIDGKYRDALTLLNELLSRRATQSVFDLYWDRCQASGRTLPAATKSEAIMRLRSDLCYVLVWEAESARIWSEGPQDYRAQMRAYQRTSQSDVRRFKAALDVLRRIDGRHAYLLRQSLEYAMQDFLSEEGVKKVKRGDPNTANGFTWCTISGPTVREHEFQFLSKLSLFHFDDLLEAWEREVDQLFRAWPSNWMEFGALRFQQAIEPRAAAKMNVVQLGLIARLLIRMRDFTAGRGIGAHGTGYAVPTDGRPCWDIIAEFVNCALDADAPLTGDTARRVWQKFSDKFEPRVQGWPRPAKSEPQVQKI